MAINSITGAGSTPPSQSASATQRLSSDYQNFLKLLTTQLKNQDPTDPTDTGELTQQIAMLSQVEQQISTNSNLEKLLGLYGATQYNSLVSYIGKQIEAPGNSGALQDGKATFAYYVQDEPQLFTVKIKNESDQTVYTAIGARELDGKFTWKDGNGGVIAVGTPDAEGVVTWKDGQGHALSGPPLAVPTAGRNEFTWKGTDNFGNQQLDGIYTVEFTAKAGTTDLPLQTYITGTVKSVDSAGGQVYLSISDILSLPLQAVTSIRQPHG